MKRRISTRKRRGFVLSLLVALITILMVSGFGLLRLGLMARTQSARNTTMITARSAADAGLTHALFEMNEKLQVKPWNDSTLPQITDASLSTSAASFSYTVTGSIDSGYIIESTGQSGHIEKKVSSTLKLKGPFEFALLGAEGLTLGPSSTVDYYNQVDGGDSLKIGMISTASDSITIQSGVSLNGDIVVNSGADPDVVVNGDTSAVAGEIYISGEAFDDLGSITVPEWLQSLPSSGSIETNTTITSSGKYDEIDLGNSNKIIIDGTVTLYIVGNVTIDNSGILEIVDVGTNPNASLTLYLGGDMEVKAGGDINNQTADAKKLKIYGLDSCQTIDFKNGSEFYGAIYAPNADVIFYNSADAFGSVISKTFDQKNGASFHYDMSLREASVNDEYTSFVTKSWEEE